MSHWVDIKLSLHLLRLAVFYFQFGCVSESEELSVTRVPAAAAADNGQSLCGCGTAEQDAEGRCPGG